VDDFKREVGKPIGPGGMRCYCCAFGKHKDRQQFYIQRARKALKNALLDEVDEALRELEEMAKENLDN